MKAAAGKTEKGDALVTVYRSNSDECKVTINSPVREMFKELQDNAVYTALEETGAERLTVEVNDYQALDFVLTARVKAALFRLRQKEEG